MAAPIVTKVDLSAHLAGDQQAALDAATDLVRDYCGWHITPEQTETLTVRGNGSSVLQLRSLRVTTVAEVRDADGTVIDATTYKVAPEGYLYGRRWTGTYEVDLTHGFAEAPALAQVILRSAAGTTSAPTAPGPATSVSLGSARIGYGSARGSAGVGGMSDADLAVLDRYKLPPLP